MVTLEELNELRSAERWEELSIKTREHLKRDPSAAYALRALAQALERLNRKEEEYEGVLLRLLEIQDRLAETAQKLAYYYRDQGEQEESIRHFQMALDAAVNERHYDLLETLWMEIIEIKPDLISLYIKITEKLNEFKQHQRSAVLLKMLLPACEERQDWKGQLEILRQILHYTPKDASLRDPIVNSMRKIYSYSPYFERVLDHTTIRVSRPLAEALAEVDLFTDFLPDTYVRHPDWGLGRVKDLDMAAKKVTINFQKKRDHVMDLDLARNAVERLSPDDFRVLCVINLQRLTALVKENPTELIKLLLSSFNGSLTAKEIKDYLVPTVIPMRDWTSWWSETNSELRKNPYIAVSPGTSKRYTLREHAASDEDELLKRFDETKAPHDKIDQIYEYLRTTKKADFHEYVLRHFSKKLQALAPRRRSAYERVEMWFTNEDLKEYVEGIESLPQILLDECLSDPVSAKQTVELLRFKTHQLQFVQRYREIQPERWSNFYLDLLLSPNFQARDELENALVAAGMGDRVNEIVDKVLADFRLYPSPFIWLTEKTLQGNNQWLEGKLQNAVLIDRLLLLIDYLTSQAKRRDKDEALWLRKVAGDAREIIRRDHYALFKEHIRESDENIAESIYRRAHTNEGIDRRTAADLTTIVRARFPNLFQQVSTEISAIPDNLLCLKETYTQKQILLKRLIEQELPAVVREIETARQHGDLRENAEYHAAKDKQKLLASQTAELQEAMHSAKVVNLEEVNPDRIMFGTRFRVCPSGSSRLEEYLMLGPWESAPERNILSYQAPFARVFMGKAIGEHVEIELPMHTGRYEIISIEVISLEELKKVDATVETRAAETEASLVG